MGMKNGLRSLLFASALAMGGATDRPLRLRRTRSRWEGYSVDGIKAIKHRRKRNKIAAKSRRINRR